MGSETDVWSSECDIARSTPSLAGAWLDRPCSGDGGPGWSLVIGGWVLGRDSRAREVQKLIENVGLKVYGPMPSSFWYGSNHLRERPHS